MPGSPRQREVTSSSNEWLRIGKREREREREEGSRALSHTNTSATQRAHIMLVNSLAAEDTSGVLGRKLIQRRDCREHDVYIKIKYCGICHSDLHQIRAEWDMSIYYPMVPGHEIVGVVESVGESVTKFKQGDRVGVGSMLGLNTKPGLI